MINKKLEKQIIELSRKKAIKYISKKLKLDTKEAGKIYEEWRYDYVREIKYPLY